MSPLLFSFYRSKPLSLVFSFFSLAKEWWIPYVERSEIDTNSNPSFP
uniref:Uncharacterized protein n=1 Tax=Arundo donax TaxID=35708 RepID=A0A0A9A3D4_ARUDO